MRISRLFTSPNKQIYDQIEWKVVEAKITDGKTGAVIVHMPEVEVPVQWSQNAVDILARTYLRKAGVPKALRTDTKLHPEDWGKRGMPVWLLPKTPAEGTEFGPETSAAQMFHRMAGCWTYWGWREKLLLAQEEAQAFYDELYWMLAMQIGAPNSPQWFNTGLHWAYGIEGPASGQWVADELEHDGQWSLQPGHPLHVYETTNAYERPQPHACFIQSVDDDLVNPGGIMDLWMREVRLFKGGSGTGSNFSKLRGKGEHLSGGGSSSGLMSFLSIGDTAAGAIASGGTTRRAAKMIVVDADHPEIEEYIDWKVKEENKAAAMYIGSQVLKHLNEGKTFDDLDIPQQMIDRISNGFKPEIYGKGWEEEAITTVDGQNSNNSIRLTNKFMEMAERSVPALWGLTNRTNGEISRAVYAQELWNKICRAAWACADPGLQFDDTINEWHTCPVDGRINASNPCAEYLFLDDTACNLASLNLVKFLRDDGELDLHAFEHAVRLYTTVLEISVFMASFPSKAIALGSYNYRTLGLGYANLGALLMRLAVPYDSNRGRALAAGITALMTGVAYRTSAEMADEIGPFPRWEANEAEMRRVLRNHRAAITDGDYSDLVTRPFAALSQQILDPQVSKLAARAELVWDEVCSAKAFRNAQTTVIAPTGTISFAMDCDTTGIEPDFALIKYKKLAGGGDVKIANQSVEPALRRLGYDERCIEDILHYLKHNDILALSPDEGRIVATEFVHRKHLDVFMCANELSPEAHIKMVAAVQPFVSGGISKTINTAYETTVDQVSEAYRLAHKLGIKSVALYRDGSKLSQPLNVRPNDTKTQSEPIVIAAYKGKTAIAEAPRTFARGERETLPYKRPGWTNKFRVDGQSLYLRTGEYPDGRLGEIFVDIGFEGSTLRSVLGGFCKAISIGLQYGVPPKEFVDAFCYMKFDPSGLVEGHDNVKQCMSLFDLIFRVLGIEYLEMRDLGNVVATIGEASWDKLDKEAVGYLTTALQTIRTNNKITLPPGVYRSGGECPVCHSMKLEISGSCVTCRTCGANTGCV